MSLPEWAVHHVLGVVTRFTAMNVLQDRAEDQAIDEGAGKGAVGGTTEHLVQKRRNLLSARDKRLLGGGKSRGNLPSTSAHPYGQPARNRPGGEPKVLWSFSYIVRIDERRPASRYTGMRVNGKRSPEDPPPLFQLLPRRVRAE